ncbi:DUF5700 domain-containing putative Zn-dependent protease [Thermococcus barophilus]|uniref:DUF2268 domain-containing protein n=1 Tax=Thermococcus barophilus (strain DSM 11836 / MP) TaxID=391623 RepID=F0LMT0_THEBM|nr:DUF5700 domain-containing putative Zn-dependent protease [Thermococcus barophilus]ADT84059.1 hypothetical protein TERMP_01083 [Thermococcus barophilus MP]
MLIDTFPTFLKHWDGTEESWLRYIQEYPELLEKIKWDYERYKMDWREYLKLLTKRNTDELKLAYENLLKVLPEVESEIRARFDIKDYNIVIYVGLENGAGWVTEFMGKPSILFGLEAIAELKWYDRLKGLIAHEFGHLVHWILRGEDIEKLEDEQIMWLYTEGFAQRIEDLITGRPWEVESEGWFEWCEEHEKLLKEEFLRRVKKGEALNPFFGSWYQLFGKQFLGYYLGYKFILKLEEKFSLEEIAKLEKEKIKGEILKFLED